MSFLNFELVLDEAVHPKDMVVLPLQLQLVANQKAQFLFRLGLQFPKGLLENGIQLLLDMRRFCINLFYLQIDLAQIVCELVLSPLNIGVNLFHLGRNLGIGIFQFNQRMLCHLSTHVIAKYFTVHAQSFTADAAIKLELDGLMLFAMSEFFWLINQVDSDMFGCYFGAMVFLIAFMAEVSIFRDAILLGWFWRDFGTIIAKGSLALLLFVCVDHIVDDINRKHLIVLKNHVLMLKHLGVLVFVVQVDRLKTIRTRNWRVQKFAFVIAVRLADRYFIHDAAHLFLSVLYLVESHIEDHPHIRELISFLANFENLVVLVELISGQERLQDDASFCVAAKGRAQMRAADVVYLLDDNCTCAQCELQFKFYYFPFIGSSLYFREFFKEALLIIGHSYARSLVNQIQITTTPQSNQCYNEHSRIIKHSSLFIIKKRRINCESFCAASYAITRLTANKQIYMKEKVYMIEILDLDTGTKVRQALTGPQLTYDQILQILESSNPEIDFENLVVYYFTRAKWIILVEQSLNLDEEFEWQNNESDEILLKIKYHCFYLLDEEEEKRFHDDVKTMNEKINDVHELYQDLKEKYKQQALDISIFWGSPLFAADKIQRNKRTAQFITNSEGEELQLLTNQVKYAPYVNAVTTALQTCDKKKVHLEIDQLNQKSFNQRNIFTVVYLMAHLEIEELKADQNNFKNNKKPNLKQRKGQPKKTEKKKTKNYILKKNDVQQNPSLKKVQSQPLRQDLNPVPLQRQASMTGSVEFEMIIQEKDTSSSKPDKSSLYQSTQFRQASQEYEDQNLTTSLEIDLSKTKSEAVTIKPNQFNQESKININVDADDSDGPDAQDIYYEKDHKNRIKGFKYNFLGEEINGKLCKISPKNLRKMIEDRTSRKIQLLILHSSYPYYHLEQLRELANNIILINSNPLVPQPSTIYFIKQFFTHLLQTGNIEETYEQSITDLNKLKEISISSKHSPSALKQFDERDIRFINSINQKYVHGNLQCCCCYHKHHEKCHNRRNLSPSKFAQYHYKYHAGQCECLQQNLMIHTCEGKRTLMEEHYEILDKSYNDNQFYYCCCLGKDLGFYEHSMKNDKLEQLFNINEQKDPHSIKFKYKHEKTMINEEDNQLEISEGKVTGDWTRELINAFKYVEENPLLGNAPLIIKLFEIFTQELKHCTLDIIRRSNQNEIYILCNIHGEKSTGRTTIATYFANLMIIKKLCKRIIIKTFSSIDEIHNIIENSHSETEGRPFYILIYQDKSSPKSQRNQIRVSERHFGQPISAILLSQQPILTDHSLQMQYLKPIPFSNENCQHYIKKYKHLSFQAKNNIRTLFHYGTRGYEYNDKFEIYPFSLNEFQILNLVRKTMFYDYKSFTLGLDRLSRSYIQYYIFIMYTIKFTNSISHQKHSNMMEIQNYLQRLKSERGLFFHNFDESTRGSNEEHAHPLSHQDIKNAYNNLINLNHIRDNFYLIFTSTGYKIKKKLSIILKLFINYTTVIPTDKFNQDLKIKRAANYIRIKNTPFSKQVYEATTINAFSYINRYFAQELTSIYRTYAQNRQEESEEMYDFEQFLTFHANLLVPRRNPSRRLNFDTYTRPKERRANEHNASLDSAKDIHRSNSNISDSVDENQENADIPHIYHLASVIEGGLQFIRNVVCTHFIYNRLCEDQKMELLKYSMILVNNCIILLKNKKFYDINEEYDLDVASEDNRESIFTQKFFHSTHNLESPDLKSNKSEQLELPQINNNRTYSGRDVFNSSRQYTLEQSAIKSFAANADDQNKSNATTDQLLLKELYRLSTFKGLLFLLDELSKRLQQFNCEKNEKVVQLKICVQLLAIQIRLQQLQIDKQLARTVMLPSFNNDRHLNRISQIFNEKNYNINILYAILEEEIKAGRFSQDAEGLGLIKSHIIVSLTLMASRYGKYKIVKAKSMIEEIDYFLFRWNNEIPLQTRESQSEQNRNKKQDCLNFKDLSFEYGFLRLICENEYEYIHIVESFTSRKFWVKQYRMNQEIVIYQDLISLYHHFTLKNTKTKIDYYYKLESINQQLYFFKLNKQNIALSTYIHNFVQHFIKVVENQFKKLKGSLIAIFNAEDDRDYVKTSLNQELASILTKKQNLKEFFNIKKKFHLTTLNELEKNCGCKYLCIFTSIGEKNSKEQILIETPQGRPQIIHKQKITQAISALSSSVIFICLPRRKMLAESLIRANRFKRSIIYFDFEIDSFEYFKTGSEEASISDYIVIFQKMIMIAAVKELIDVIIQKENEGFRTGTYMAFNDVKNSLSFVLRSKNGKPILRLSNKQFRRCLFIEEEDNFYQVSLPEKEIQFFDTERVNKNQIESLEKIVKKMLTKRQRTSNERFEEFKIDDFYNVYRFIEIFSFYFRDKYGFSNIYSINFSVWKQFVRSNLVIKKFLEKLIDENILDFIFSNKKGVIMLYVEPQNYDICGPALKNCETELKNITSVIDQSIGKRTINKFVGYSTLGRKISYVFVYILQSDNN